MLIFDKLFSIKREGHTKIVTVLGLSIRLTNWKQKYKDDYKKLLYKINKYCPEDKRAEALKDWFYERTGNVLNLENPKTFNEKIQWLKLYDTKPLKTRLADKYLVREWIKEEIGEEYLIPLLGVWDKAEDIDFDKLPNQFVLKCNHGAAYNIIVKDKSKLNIGKTIKTLNAWLLENYAFKYGFELQYDKIPRKIIAEKYMEGVDNQLYDYKFFCFEGKVKYIYVAIDHFPNVMSKISLFDTNWNILPINYGKHPAIDRAIEKPINLENMICLAEKLSKDFAFVRVDFYEANEKILFGEMTFTPGSGLNNLSPDKYNYELGELIKLPQHSETIS